MIDDQKWHDIVDRWHGILRYHYDMMYCLRDTETKLKDDEFKQIFVIYNKDDFSKWEIENVSEEFGQIGEHSIKFLIKSVETENKHLSLSLLELDEHFYTYKRYQDLISENKDMFLEVPYKISCGEYGEFTFQQCLSSSAYETYVYLMSFYIEDEFDPELSHLQNKLIILNEAEIADCIMNPESFMKEKIHIFKLLMKEGIKR